ncbi:MAG TPA: hypothetical protein VMS09_06600 [Paenibacillus sp.]|uniref:hypothetical protein n=1 Tax=Paenibacillus sp. TaxID=58172 RepID=UPI0028D1A31C|nr:hypothetical protein [Paenibacillus sp.]HUC91690.1 hypothetical protein [Paenibacillus sp.]
MTQNKTLQKLKTKQIPLEEEKGFGKYRHSPAGLLGAIGFSAAALRGCGEPTGQPGAKAGFSGCSYVWLIFLPSPLTSFLFITISFCKKPYRLPGGRTPCG